MFGIAPGHQYRELVQAALYPVVEQPHAPQIQILLMHLDGLFLERVCLFEEQAIGIYQANAARASEGVYDEWVRKSFEQLAELMPARYAKIEVGEDLVTALH